MPGLSGAEASILTQSAAIAAVVTFLIGILRPFIEQLPFARPSAPLHDATLRLLNLAFNLAGVFGLTAAAGALTITDWFPLLIQAIAMASGSHLLFHGVTSSAGASGSARGVTATPTSAPAPSTAASVSASVGSAVGAAVTSARSRSASAQA